MNSAIEALLIEDNPSDALLFESLIRSSEVTQLTIHHSERFNDALTALEAQCFDIILLDLCLPDGEGIELVKQLRERTPQVPIVVLTGIQDQDIAVAALKEGAQDYLVKSETFSPARLQKLGLIDVGNLLVKTLRYAIERAELAQQLEVSQERYSLAVEGAKDGIWDWDLKRDRIYYSPRWQELIGLTLCDSNRQRASNPAPGNTPLNTHPSNTTPPNTTLICSDLTDTPQEWLDRIHPDDRSKFQQGLRAHLSHHHKQFKCEYRMQHANGEYRWMLTRGMALWDEDNVAYRIAGSQTDITDRKSLENALYQEKELAQITLQSIGDAVITTDSQGRIKDFNPVAERLTGWKAREAKRLPVSQVCNLIDGNTRKPLHNPAIKAIQEGQSVTLSSHPTLISKSGEEFAIGDSAAPIRATNGDIIGTVMVFHDVTEERGRAKQLAWQATHDPLTHLFNRQRFLQSVDSAIEEAKLGQVHHVLCCMDLDHFKAVNDTCGHAAGDELLIQISNLWRNQIRSSDSLARLGGDEFGLLLYGCDMDRAITIAEGFCNSIRTFRFHYQGHTFRLGVSVGVVPISGQTTDTQEVLKLADSACYSAKNKGRNRVQVYYPNDDDIAQQSSDSQWFSRITEALDKDQFCLYQQIITKAVTQADDMPFCEILLRLKQNDSSEVMLPMSFIPPAERYNLMPKIDRWVIEHFLTYLAEHPSPIKMLYTINLSGSSINDDDFVDFLKEQLEKHPIDPTQICFEITETVAISNLQKAADFILDIKQLGCKFALDDFGSGMSSFTYLKNLPVDYLKIDGNFVREAPTDNVICAMLTAINQVGHVMGLETIAEYVEDDDILAKVQDIGIDYAQGYGISYPKPLQPAAD